MSFSMRSWVARLTDSFARCFAQCFITTLNFVVRPKIGEAEAYEIARTAAAARNWAIGKPMLIDRVVDCYSGLAFIEGTEIAVLWMVHARSGELLQLERSDELSDSDESPATQL